MARHVRSAVLPALAAFISGLAVAQSGDSQSGDSVRGMYLYENHCVQCHASVVHVREDRQATTPEQVDAFVRRWTAYLELPWTEEEIRDVLSHLRARYYEF